MADAPADDLRKTLDRFLTTLYASQRKNDHALPLDLSVMTVEVAIPAALTEKIARYLEHEGYLEFEKDQVDLTVEGILKAEAILRREAHVSDEETESDD